MATQKEKGSQVLVENCIRLVSYDHGQKVRGKKARKVIEDEIGRKVMNAEHNICQQAEQLLRDALCFGEKDKSGV